MGGNIVYYVVIIIVQLVGLFLSTAWIMFKISHSNSQLRDDILERITRIETTQNLKFKEFEKDINHLYAEVRGTHTQG